MTIRYGGVTVVIPSIREDCIKKFFEEWAEDFKDIQVIVVEDNPEKSFSLPENVVHVSWAEIDKDLGDNGWIIPRRTSAIRSYGTLLAYRSGSDIIWHLDDDCYPEDHRKGSYLYMLEAQFSRTWPDGQWWNTIHGTGFYPRGFPYRERATVVPTMLHHGLWSNVPDFDGITQLANPYYRLHSWLSVERVPYGQLFPMCGMNLAFKRKMAPLMYMLLQGKDYPFDRFDDMWAGLFMKLTADHLGFAVTSGAPSIRHSKASDPERNKMLEAPGIAAHETLWRDAKSVSLAGCVTPAECYLKFSDMVRERASEQEYPEYWKKLAEAMKVWTDLFEVTS